MYLQKFLLVQKSKLHCRCEAWTVKTITPFKIKIFATVKNKKVISKDYNDASQCAHAFIPQKKKNNTFIGSKESIGKGSPQQSFCPIGISHSAAKKGSKAIEIQ